MKIIVNILPKEKMRYDTLGDYYYDENGDLHFDIADVGNIEYTKLILLHEMIEEFCITHNGIKEEDIYDFDLQFEKECREGKHKDLDEPGEHPDAPYRNEHIFSEWVEKLICTFTKIDFNKYNNYLLNIFNNTRFNNKR